MSCPLIFVLDHSMFILDLSMIYINRKILANTNNCHNQSKINENGWCYVHCCTYLIGKYMKMVTSLIIEISSIARR